MTDAFGGSGGIAEYNRQLLSALAMSKHVKQVIALPRFGVPSAPLPVGLTQLTALPNRFSWSAQAVRLAVQNSPDVILCGHINASPLAATIGKVISRPIWTQVHGIEAWSERSGLMRRSVEASSLVTSVSRYTRHRLLAWCGVSPDRVRVLPNTFSPAHRAGTKREELVSRHALQGRKVVLTVGRLVASEAYKGHDRIIRCLPRLRAFVPEAVYLIVGSGNDQTRLEKLARELNSADHVIFAGQIAAPELPDYYALADAFAMPSTGEGFGIVFLEAAAYGLPVVGGNRDGSIDALADGVIGVPVDPNDEDALTASLVNALSGRKQESADSVQRFAFENFSRHVDDLVRSLAR